MSKREVPPLQGDEHELFTRYDTRLHAATRAWINTTDANVDDACAYAWSRFVACQPRRDTVYAWLRVVARNQALLLDRRDRSQMSHEDVVEIDRVDDDGRAIRQVEANILTQQIMEPLRPREREAVLLRGLGWTREEASERMGISLGRLDRMLDIGTKKVRELVRDREPLPSRVKLVLEMQARPPLFLRGAIGPAPTASPKHGRAEQRMVWTRVALAIVDFRASRGITDPVRALGEPSDRRDDERRVVEGRIDRYNGDRARTRESQRGAER